MKPHLKPHISSTVIFFTENELRTRRLIKTQREIYLLPSLRNSTANIYS